MMVFWGVGDEDRFERFLEGSGQELVIVHCGSVGEAHVKHDSLLWLWQLDGCWFY